MTRVLYGVQGTGNGHITRARSMVKSFQKKNISVDFLFSGRKPEDYFDMSCFGNYDVRKGLTFQVDKGRVNYLKTAWSSDIRQFRRDYKQLDLSPYDIILTDFEPITAWAGKSVKQPLVGIGHQYVFDYPVPQKKAGLISRYLLKNYAPARKSMAVHWHHFDQPILPPIIESDSIRDTIVRDKHVLVYLPFEDQQTIGNVFSDLGDYKFFIYSPAPMESQWSHIKFKPLSREGFLTDLHQCDAVVANAGFELSSEALHLGKRLLVKPLSGQVEQHSNAIALKYLGYGQYMNELNVDSIREFLVNAPRVTIHFPDVALKIVEWIDQGMPEIKDSWYRDIWSHVKVIHS